MKQEKHRPEPGSASGEPLGRALDLNRRFYAHTARDKDGRLWPVDRWQPLRDHLRNVAALASRFGRPCGLEREAFLAGLLHDMGKYADQFQERLKNPSIHHVNHWAAGAVYAVKDLCSGMVGYAVDGHHTGMPAAGDLRQTCLRMQEDPLRREHTQCVEGTQELLQRLKADGVNVPSAPPRPGNDCFADALRTRLLFSCIVDADFLDTEAHFDGEAAKDRVAPDLQAEGALDILRTHLDAKPSGGTVNRLRRNLLSDCLRAAEKPRGLFTLTAPTGGGKTLSSLAFAMKHIVHTNASLAPGDPYRLRRVIVVIPYTTIIEQTARVYRELFEAAFGPLYVLEHHSAVAPRERDEDHGRDAEEERLRLARLAAENWDAPLVVTTSVQFFESLFSHKPSTCRKLHNIACSVVLFDEVQTLPSRLVPSLLSAVRLLTRDFGVTAVFMTATQPAFDQVGPRVLPAHYDWRPTEMSSEPEAMAEAMRRTQVRMPETQQHVSWAELASELTEHRQALCVVNTTRDARTLFRLLPPSDRFHLSSRLCPAHRQLKLRAVQERLSTGGPCRLVSTQLIEAGVDVDFPVAFRAMGPLDSIIQTAGRCNREGRQPQPGPVFVFRPSQGGTPRGAYATARAKTEEFLARHPDAKLHLPEVYRMYFAELYALVGPEKADADEVFELSSKFDFPKADERCRLVGEDTQPVLVRWGTGEHLIEKLRTRRHLAPDEWRTAQRHSVNLYAGEFIEARSNGYVVEAIEGTWFWNSQYDDDLGACHLEDTDLVC